MLIRIILCLEMPGYEQLILAGLTFILKSEKRRASDAQDATSSIREP